MKNGLVIADSGSIFSLAIIDKLELLIALFDEIAISQSVWEEVSRHKTKPFHNRIYDFFKDKVHQIKGVNNLTFVMDYGESESVILYEELQADFLLIDDKKARSFAESMGVQCIGTIGLLSISKDRGLVDNLKPLFIELIQNKRFYSLDLLNKVLNEKGEFDLFSSE